MAQAGGEKLPAHPPARPAHVNNTSTRLRSLRLLGSLVVFGTPEGQLTIAQRFSVGLGRPLGSSPEGTADNAVLPAQPSLRDWSFPLDGHPTLKRWAIFKHPSGMTQEAVHATIEEISH